MAGSKKTGRLIRYKRNEMGMTQDQLSKIINFTPAAISAWENGVRYPGPDAQLGIYNALGLNAVELLVGLGSTRPAWRGHPFSADHCPSCRRRSA